MSIEYRDRHPAVARPIAGSAARGSTPAERARTEALLAQYPDLDLSQLGELKHWFRRRATAADVASLACNERLYSRYRAFHEQHIDRFTVRDKAVIAVLTSLPLALVAIGLAADA